MSKNHNYLLKNCAVLWHFIIQPIFHQATLLNPFKFWHVYQLRERLEKSWDYDAITLLERCLQIKNEAK
ncbi:hypothetical protein IQ259_25555 [Fortiea sp. LEGE XX443]|uniref:hypothetical protein n=1 Tax=Fortiea sp. LEGE XX443 TaxID=1828611 RepID=UPI0019F14205|nr:hypothetical protein [Fortiea sp. LEGE XX443]